MIMTGLSPVVKTPPPCAGRFLPLPVERAFDDELERGGLKPVDNCASIGSAIIARISGGSLLLVTIVLAARCRSTIKS